MNENWQSNALQSLLREYLKEQRRRRRWGIFFKLILLITIVLILSVVVISGVENKSVNNSPHAALIDIEGILLQGGRADADRIATSLHHAFSSKGTKGIILRIDSPGGSPVQADYIYNEIISLRKKHPDIKVYAVCTDICASGAYYIASAADKIYTNPASLVGSIGVIMNGFGFVEAMKKLGISRRVFTSGSQKLFLDPFVPLDTEQVKETQIMLDIVHQQFIKAVKKGRGKRLKLSTPNLFSGRFWTGKQARSFGLIDEFGSAGWVARNVIKEDNIVNYTITPSYWERFADRLGGAASTMMAGILGLQQTPKLG